MSTQPSNLQQELEWATRRSPNSEIGDADACAHPETRELQEAWSALTECLQAGDSQAGPITEDPSAWLVHVLGNDPGASSASPTISPPSTRWTIAIALSLSLLVVGGCVWLSRLTHSTSDMIARRMASPNMELAHQERPSQAPVPSRPREAASDLDWNDELDERLLEASETLVAIRAEWRSPDSVDVLSERVQELRSQWDEDSL